MLLCACLFALFSMVLPFEDIDLVMDRSVSRFMASPKPEMPDCPWTSIVSISASPDLPTQIWEYCTVYAVGRYTGLDPFVPPLIHIKLSYIFKGLTVLPFTLIRRCTFKRENFVFRYSDWKDMDKGLLISKGAIELSLVMKYFDALLEQFELTDDFRRAGKIAIQRALKYHDSDTVIGIYINKNDFEYLSLIPGAMAYYIKAIDYFREEYGKVTFLVLCGTNPICSDKFSDLKDVYVYKYDNIERLDVAILSLCDHVIFKSGGIGLWGGLLAGGKTAYYYCGDLVVNGHGDETMVHQLVGKTQKCPNKSE